MPFPVITSSSYPSEGRVFNKLKSENYVKYVVHAVSQPRQFTPTCPLLGQHTSLHTKCSVDIRAEQKHKNEEENIPFSSPVPSLAGARSETDQRWPSKWKQVDSQLFVLGARGHRGDAARVTVAGTSRSTLRDTAGVSWSSSPNSPTLKKEKLPLGRPPLASSWKVGNTCLTTTRKLPKLETLKDWK